MVRAPATRRQSFGGHGAYRFPRLCPLRSYHLAFILNRQVSEALLTIATMGPWISTTLKDPCSNPTPSNPKEPCTEVDRLPREIYTRIFDRFTPAEHAHDRLALARCLQVSKENSDVISDRLHRYLESSWFEKRLKLGAYQQYWGSESQSWILAKRYAVHCHQLVMGSFHSLRNFLGITIEKKWDERAHLIGLTLDESSAVVIPHLETLQITLPSELGGGR